MINDMVCNGQIGLINMCLLDLLIDEIVQWVVDLIYKMKVIWIVIDLLLGFELVVVLSFCEDFCELLFCMVVVFFNFGVMVLMIFEFEDCYVDLCFSFYGLVFFIDVIIVQCYIEIDSCLKCVMVVVKVCGSVYCDEFW